jgi:hypothetical protein
MYTTNYTVQNLCYTSSQYMSAEHNTEWQKQKNWKDRNKNFNRTLSCWCVCVCVCVCVFVRTRVRVCVCVHAHMHTYSHTDRQYQILEIPTFVKTWGRNLGRYPLSRSTGPTYSQSLEAVSRAQQSMNLWHFEVHSHDVKDLSHVN